MPFVCVFVMAALRSRCGHYILPWFLSIFFFPRLISAAAHWMSTILRKNDAKNRHLSTIAQLCRTKLISLQLRHVSTVGKKFVKPRYLLHISHNMANLGPLAAEIGPVVWGTLANFNEFRVLAALLHGTVVVGVSQTLRR